MGATPASINTYDFDNISGLGTGLPGVTVRTSRVPR